MADAAGSPVLVVGRRRVRVEPVMGTVASLHLGGAAEWDGARAAAEEAAVSVAFEHLHDIDRRFSWYRDDSEIRRIDRGELDAGAASPDVREVLRACEELRESTGGVFDVRGHRPDGSLDPSGYVKGWAVEGAAEILRAAGIRDFCLDVGGDVVASGEPEPDRGWRVGIRHPEIARATAAILEVRDLAVATSGSYERGDHIRDARTGAPSAGLASITIVGSSLAQADVHATIAFAMGLDGIAWAARQPGLEVLAITPGGRVRWTPGLDDLLVAPRTPDLDDLLVAPRTPGLDELHVAPHTPGSDDFLVAPRPPAPGRPGDSPEGRAGSMPPDASA